MDKHYVIEQRLIDKIAELNDAATGLLVLGHHLHAQTNDALVELLEYGRDPRKAAFLRTKLAAQRSARIRVNGARA